MSNGNNGDTTYEGSILYFWPPTLRDQLTDEAREKLMGVDYSFGEDTIMSLLGHTGARSLPFNLDHIAFAQDNPEAYSNIENIAIHEGVHAVSNTDPWKNLPVIGSLFLSKDEKAGIASQRELQRDIRNWYPGLLGEALYKPDEVVAEGISQAWKSGGLHNVPEEARTFYEGIFKPGAFDASAPDTPQAAQLKPVSTNISGISPGPRESGRRPRQTARRPKLTKRFRPTLTGRTRRNTRR